MHEPREPADPEPSAVEDRVDDAAEAARGARPGPGRGEGQGAAAGAAAARRRAKDVPVGQRSGDGRDPKLLGDQLDQFVVERGWVVDVAVGPVIGRWPQIVGPEIAQHCAPVDFVDGVLTVRADSTAWATQLRLLLVEPAGRLDRGGRRGHGRRAARRRPGCAVVVARAASGAGRPGPRDTYG